MWQCNLPSEVLQDATQAASVCYLPSGQDSSNCVAICPNQDISGVGVRSAFYIQSVLNTILVILSRRDSVPTTWATTLLTAALVIAAMVQKRTQSITLHHAVLTMNFATLSCISSLAVAPTLAIWRLKPHEYYARRLAHDILDHDGDQDRSRLVGSAVEAIAGRNRRRFKRAQSRQRLFLALAILTQVALQWAWGIILFVSPVYSQPNCSGSTKLIFFLNPFTGAELNQEMEVWALWLLFSLGITLAMTVVLALTSPSRARSLTTPGSRWYLYGRPKLAGPAKPFYQHLLCSIFSAFPPWSDKPRQMIFWYNVLSILLWGVYIIASELQIRANCIFGGSNGEDSITSFGQISALLLSLAPLWSLVGALKKWIRAQWKIEQQYWHHAYGAHAHDRSGPPSAIESISSTLEELGLHDAVATVQVVPVASSAQAIASPVHEAVVPSAVVLYRPSVPEETFRSRVFPRHDSESSHLQNAGFERQVHAPQIPEVDIVSLAHKY